MIDESQRHLRQWLTLFGLVVLVCVLYFAQAVLVPLALAILLAFLLTPTVAWFERRIGRVAAVLLVTSLAFTGLGAAAYSVTTQLGSAVGELPKYRQNIRQKIRDVRAMATGGSLEQLQDTIEDIEHEINQGDPVATPPAVVVEPKQVGTLSGLPQVIGPALEPLATVGLVVALVIFLLLERQELRDRLLRLFGSARVPITIKALDEAGTRVSRYLVMQSIVNACYGLGVGIGLYLLGVPYPMLWAALGAALRFIPYVGPWIAAGAPVLLAFAVLPGWERPLGVVALFVGLELVTNMFLETVFYAGVAGVSSVGLLVAVAFWTWLWGPLGLLLATPLTVCITVLGKYVPTLEFVTVLLSDEPGLEDDVRFYQHLLTGNAYEAERVLDEHVEAAGPEAAYDAIVVPALCHARRDLAEGRLSAEEEHALLATASEILDDMPAALQGDCDASRPDVSNLPPLVGYPVGSEAAVLALQMFDRTLGMPAGGFTVLPRQTSPQDLIDEVRRRQAQAVCLASVPPSRLSTTAQLVKRLRALDPAVKIVVGRWTPHGVSDGDVALLRDAGADAVAATLTQSRTQLLALFPQAAEGPSIRLSR
jgi:predicted PurR-regulated permease PerM